MDEVGLSCTDVDLLISKVELLCGNEAMRAWIAPKTHQQNICVVCLVCSVYHSACRGSTSRDAEECRCHTCTKWLR